MKKLYTLFILLCTFGFSFGQTYCVPTGGGSSTTYYLNNVTTTGGITNIAYTANSYSAYVNNSATSFASIPGGTVNVSLAGSGGAFTTFYYYVWVDWNNDGDFLDAGETVLATTTYTTTASAVINVPNAQAAGNYRVRFSNSYIGQNTSCGPAAWGNYVDCSIQVGPPPTCIVPTNLAFSNVLINSATISWTASTSAPANGYQYYLTTTNVPPVATTTPTGTSPTTSANLSGLTLNTTYYFWVRAVCSPTDSSYWAAGPSFTTPQIPTTIPYTQPFTGPNDFVFVNGTQTNKWAYGAATGNPANSIYISNDNGTTNAYTGTTSIVHAYRDIIVPGGTTTATLTFDWKGQGESSFDICRVWLVPITFQPTAGTQITAAANRIQVGTNLGLQNSWQTYFNAALNLSVFQGTTMRLVFEWKNDGSGNFDPPIAIDNINLLIPTCQVPNNLTFTNLTATSVTINWTAATPAPVNGYQYYYSTNNTPPLFNTPPSGATPGLTANLTPLLPNTTYYWWVRSKCAGTDASLWRNGGSFTTGQIPATFPYINPFTNPVDFTFTTGTQVNKWAYGGVTGNTGNSIYISNDAGVTNAYTINSTSVTHAYRDIQIPAGTSIVQFSFDWKAQGEGSFDYLRVWLVPITYQPTPGTQITAAGGSPGRVQVGTNFNQQNTWQQYQNLTLNISQFATQTMRLVFEWRNDGSGGTQPPAAVDNIKIVRCDNTPPVVTITNLQSNSATLSWPQDPNGASYLVRYRVAGSTAWLPSTAGQAVAAVLTPTNTFTIPGLSPVTSYEAEVAAVCNNVAGVYTRVNFQTPCDPTPPGNLTVSNITAYTANVTWDPILTATYVLEYREVGATAWIPSVPANLTTTNYALTGLTPYTTYEVRVASNCSGATNPFGTPKVFTTRPICEMAPIGLTVTNLTINSAQVDWNNFPGATYVLMYREVGFNNWVTVNLGTNTYIINGLVEQTQYEVKVANVCGGVLQVFTAPYVFTTPTIIYCDMSALSSSAEHISNVKVTPNGRPEMNNDSGPSNYTDYTGNAVKTIQLIQGSTNNQISITKKWAGTTYNEAVTVWIDFNRDGIFSNNERILTSDPSKTTPLTATFNVPANAYVSLVDNRYVVMRVAMSRNAAPIMCAQFANGEVEDYKVRISKPTTDNLLVGDAIVRVYPNPVKDILNITKVKDGTKYEIYNAIGQLVMKGTVIANKLNVSRLINGVYIINLDSPDDQAQVKFIKE